MGPVQNGLTLLPPVEPTDPFLPKRDLVFCKWNRNGFEGPLASRPDIHGLRFTWKIERKPEAGDENTSMANVLDSSLLVTGWGGGGMKHLGHHIGVYIPTTAGIGHTVDATRLVEKTLAFLGERFGGATSIKGQGVWNSDAGLVSETVYIVQAFTTQTGMNRHFNDVVEYAKAIKASLKQEAMALEVDRQMILL